MAKHLSLIQCGIRFANVTMRLYQKVDFFPSKFTLIIRQMICDQNIFQLIPITWNQPSLNEIVIFMFSKFTFTFNLRTWIEKDNILLHYNVTNGQNFFLQKLWQSVRERLSQIWSVIMWLIQLQSILDQIFEPDCNNGWDFYDGCAKKLFSWEL